METKTTGKDAEAEWERTLGGKYTSKEPLAGAGRDGGDEEVVVDEIHGLAGLPAMAPRPDP